MKKTTKWIVAALILVAVLLLYPQIRPLLNQQTLKQTIVPFGVFAPIAFGIIYIVAGLLFLPLSALSVIAGILFGILGGLATVLISATIAAALAFLIARPCCDLLPRARQGIIRKLQHTVEHRLKHNTFQTIFILRLLYMPYIGLSYAAGLVRTSKFWPFVWATFLTNIIGSFVFVYLGNQLSKGFTALIIPVILIALSLLIPHLIKKMIKK